MTTRVPVPAASEPLLDDDSLRRQARHNVGRQLGFGIHLLVFVAVNAWMLARQATSDASMHRPWPLWGWALGLGIHGLVTLLSVRGHGLRARMEAAELARLRQQAG